MSVISLKIPETQVKKIKEFAKIEGYTSQSEFIRDAIRRRMESSSFLLSKEDIEAIKEGREDIRKGRIHAPEKVRKELGLED